MYTNIYQVSSLLVEIKLVFAKFPLYTQLNKLNFASPNNTLKAVRLGTSLYE
jgi:hypothetical protein